jgi:hypothetical protein
MNDSNRERLITAARLLRPLLGELVFVGGAVTGLLITDEAAADPRTTFDVDAIAELTSYAEYAAFGDRLRALGFQEDTREGAPLCRWVHHGTTLDVMPLDEKILGFSSRWYRAAMKASATEESSPWQTLPKEIRDRFALRPNAGMEFHMVDGSIVAAPFPLPQRQLPRRFLENVADDHARRDASSTRLATARPCDLACYH